MCEHGDSIGEIKGDVKSIKEDVGEIKVDVKETNGRVGDLELREASRDGAIKIASIIFSLLIAPLLIWFVVSVFQTDSIDTKIQTAIEEQLDNREL